MPRDPAHLLERVLNMLQGGLRTADVAVRYREDILLPHVVPVLQTHPDMTLQHDNATSHISRSVREPDLNAIEYIWDLLDRRVRARAIPPRNVWELAGALVEEWGNISQRDLANLVQSMRRRCTGVLNAAGDHTIY
jgi:hypothetical protein